MIPSATTSSIRSRWSPPTTISLISRRSPLLRRYHHQITGIPSSFSRTSTTAFPFSSQTPQHTHYSNYYSAKCSSSPSSNSRFIYRRCFCNNRNSRSLSFSSPSSSTTSSSTPAPWPPPIVHPTSSRRFLWNPKPPSPFSSSRSRWSSDFKHPLEHQCHFITTKASASSHSKSPTEESTSPQKLSSSRLPLNSSSSSSPSTSTTSSSSPSRSTSELKAAVRKALSNNRITLGKKPVSPPIWYSETFSSMFREPGSREKGKGKTYDSREKKEYRLQKEKERERNKLKWNRIGNLSDEKQQQKQQQRSYERKRKEETKMKKESELGLTSLQRCRGKKKKEKGMGGTRAGGEAKAEPIKGVEWEALFKAIGGGGGGGGSSISSSHNANSVTSGITTEYSSKRDEKNQEIEKQSQSQSQLGRSLLELFSSNKPTLGSLGSNLSSELTTSSTSASSSSPSSVPKGVQEGGGKVETRKTSDLVSRLQSQPAGSLKQQEGDRKIPPTNSDQSSSPTNIKAPRPPSPFHPQVSGSEDPIRSLLVPSYTLKPSCNARATPSGHLLLRQTHPQSMKKNTSGEEYDVSDHGTSQGIVDWDLPPRPGELIQAWWREGLNLDPESPFVHEVLKEIVICAQEVFTPEKNENEIEEGGWGKETEITVGWLRDMLDDSVVEEMRLKGLMKDDDGGNIYTMTIDRKRKVLVEELGLPDWLAELVIRIDKTKGKGKVDITSMNFSPNESGFEPSSSSSPSTSTSRNAMDSSSLFFSEFILTPSHQSTLQRLYFEHHSAKIKASFISAALKGNMQTESGSSMDKIRAERLRSEKIAKKKERGEMLEKRARERKESQERKKNEMVEERYKPKLGEEERERFEKLSKDERKPKEEVQRLTRTQRRNKIMARVRARVRAKAKEEDRVQSVESKTEENVIREKGEILPDPFSHEESSLSPPPPPSESPGSDEQIRKVTSPGEGGLVTQKTDYSNGRDVGVTAKTDPSLGTSRDDWGIQKMAMRRRRRDANQRRKHGGGKTSVSNGRMVDDELRKRVGNDWSGGLPEPLKEAAGSIQVPDHRSWIASHTPDMDAPPKGTSKMNKDSPPVAQRRSRKTKAKLKRKMRGLLDPKRGNGVDAGTKPEVTIAHNPAMLETEGKLDASCLDSDSVIPNSSSHGAPSPSSPSVSEASMEERAHQAKKHAQVKKKIEASIRRWEKTSFKLFCHFCIVKDMVEARCEAPEEQRPQKKRKLPRVSTSAGSKESLESFDFTKIFGGSTMDTENSTPQTFSTLKPKSIIVRVYPIVSFTGSRQENEPRSWDYYNGCPAEMRKRLVLLPYADPKGTSPAKTALEEAKPDLDFGGFKEKLPIWTSAYPVEVELGADAGRYRHYKPPVYIASKSLKALDKYSHQIDPLSNHAAELDHGTPFSGGQKKSTGDGHRVSEASSSSKLDQDHTLSDLADRLVAPSFKRIVVRSPTSKPSLSKRSWSSAAATKWESVMWRQLNRLLRDVGYKKRRNFWEGADYKESGRNGEGTFGEKEVQPHLNSGHGESRKPTTKADLNQDEVEHPFTEDEIPEQVKGFTHLEWAQNYGYAPRLGARKTRPSSFKEDLGDDDDSSRIAADSNGYGDSEDEEEEYEIEEEENDAEDEVDHGMSFENESTSVEDIKRSKEDEDAFIERAEAELESDSDSPFSSSSTHSLESSRDESAD